MPSSPQPLRVQLLPMPSSGRDMQSRFVYTGFSSRKSSFYEICDLGWSRGEDHHLRAGDGFYKSWSVPGFADPFLWLYDTTPCTSSPLIVPNCKKSSLNAKSDANLRIRSGSYFMNCEINLNRTSCSSDVGVGDGETLEWLCWRSKAANSVNSLICSSLKS